MSPASPSGRVAARDSSNSPSTSTNTTLRDGVAAVRPGVVGAALHDDVAGTQRHLGVVQDEGDLALEHDAVVDGRGAVHRRLQAPLVQVPGLELVDPDLGAARRRGYGEGPFGRLGRLDRDDPGRRALGVPDLVERDAVIGELPAHRHRTVGQDDRDAVGGVTGDHPARAGHAWHAIGPPWKATMSGHTDGTVSRVHPSVPPEPAESSSAYARCRLPTNRSVSAHPE